MWDNAATVVAFAGFPPLQIRVSPDSPKPPDWFILSKRRLIYETF